MSLKPSCSVLDLVFQPFNNAPSSHPWAFCGLWAWQPVLAKEEVEAVAQKVQHEPWAKAVATAKAAMGKRLSRPPPSGWQFPSQSKKEGTVKKADEILVVTPSKRAMMGNVQVTSSSCLVLNLGPGLHEHHTFRHLFSSQHLDLKRACHPFK